MRGAVPLGPVMLDVKGMSLTLEDRELLSHPQCGGVILFSRNVGDVEQVQALTKQIRQARSSELLIAVDQEGGRVQRLKNGFLSLPAPRGLGEIFDTEPGRALSEAHNWGWLMASECLAAGLDFSFAPVLDVDYGNSTVIGDRAFHSDPNIIARLASAHVSGMREAGMPAVVKHFPGHGHVVADSHLDVAVDTRSYADIAAADLIPFKALIDDGVQGVMPAHVIYSDCDPNPAGFSHYWLKNVLREHLGFNGVVFSDDLSMQAAVAVGSPGERAVVALSAGCDMLLVCNDPNAAGEVLEAVEGVVEQHSTDRLESLRCRRRGSWKQLHASDVWCERAASLV